MRNYDPVIKKENLVHGAYYKGTCRNATEARWNADKGLFYHWRNKFDNWFIETICCPEDDARYDVFVTEELLETPEKEIPFKD